MKERIYTVPLNEAFDADTECAFCELHKKLNEDALRYTLGASYMEEDVRETTDNLGFCKAHYKEMYDIQNRLGLSLILSTHLKKINEKLDKALKSDFKTLDSAEKTRIFKKANSDKMSKTAELISKTEDSCFICEKIKSSMDRYVETFFFLWRTEPDFKNKVLNSKGFCLEHFGVLIDEGKSKLNQKEYAEFIGKTAPIVQKSLKRVEEELLWFIKKFDYRFDDLPWKNSKNSLQRGILKTAGVLVDKINYDEADE